VSWRRWSLVGCHARALWPNGASWAYSYYGTVIGNPTPGIQWYNFRPPGVTPNRGMGPPWGAFVKLLWPLVNHFYPSFCLYRQRCPQRSMPVFRLFSGYVVQKWSFRPPRPVAATSCFDKWQIWHGERIVKTMSAPPCKFHIFSVRKYGMIAPKPSNCGNFANIYLLPSGVSFARF